MRRTVDEVHGITALELQEITSRAQGPGIQGPGITSRDHIQGPGIQEGPGTTSSTLGIKIHSDSGRCSFSFLWELWLHVEP